MGTFVHKIGVYCAKIYAVLRQLGGYQEFARKLNEFVILHTFIDFLYILKLFCAVSGKFHSAAFPHIFIRKFLTVLHNKHQVITLLFLYDLDIVRVTLRFRFFAFAVQYALRLA